jgi:hypothetical protein
MISYRMERRTSIVRLPTYLLSSSLDIDIVFDNNSIDLPESNSY